MNFNEKINLVHGDCLEVMPSIPDGSVDMILCDLPYERTSIGWDILIPFEPLWRQYERIVKKDGNIVLFGVGTFAFRLALSNEKLFRYDMVWKKSKCGSPLTAKYMPLKKHEMILVFGRSASKYYPQMKRGTPYKRSAVNVKTNNHGYGINHVTTDNKGTRHPTTILDYPQKWRRQDQVHPTQKPIELLEELVKLYTIEGETVLDNTMGSGSTGVACRNLNRKFIGIEKDENYFDIASKRIYENNSLFT